MSFCATNKKHQSVGDESNYKIEGNDIRRAFSVGPGNRRFLGHMVYAYSLD